MKVTPLTLRSHRALIAKLRSHGWDAGESIDAAGGLEPVAFHFTGITEDVRLELVRYAGKIGLELLTGDDWAILAGSRSRAGALARPWVVPVALAELANILGIAMPAEPEPRWQTARGPVQLDRPIIMGILNVTPDSFSDGGSAASVDAACARARVLCAEGADIIDIGGESTRPGRTARVTPEEETARVVPVVRVLLAEDPTMIISVDTMTPVVAQAALEAGAAIINDVSAGRADPAMMQVAAKFAAGVVLMHSRGGALELAEYSQGDASADMVTTVLDELTESLAAASRAGVAIDALVVDPGLGFAKTPAQSIALLDEMNALQALGRPILVGPSRKRFLGEVTGLPVSERDGVTAVACALAYERGARIFRVHAVAPTRAALHLVSAMATQPTAL